LSRTVLPDTLQRPSFAGQKTENDQQLIRATASGSEIAFGEIYQRYHRPIYNYLFRIIQDEAGADDILQEVFLAIWQGANKFKHQSSVKTWIYRIAYKQSISWLRKHPRKISQMELEEIVDKSKSPEESAITAIQNTQLKRAMADLAPKHRAVLELAFIEEMSYSEIAEILNCPIGTVKSRMSYALRNLNQVMLKLGIDHWEDGGKEK
jgi:RNA polymerase sigma-70 factor (ECF subfamily)